MMLITKEDITVPVTVQRELRSHQIARFSRQSISRSCSRAGDRFPRCGVRNQTGVWDHAGASRNPILSDGSIATEKITEYTPGHSFAYEVTGFTNIVLRQLVSGVRGEWTYTPDGSGTVIRWTYEFKPLRRRYWLVRRVLTPLCRHYMQAGVEAAAHAADDR